MRRRGRASFCEVDELAEPLRAPASESPESLLLGRERSLRLEEGLGLLTSRERTALILRDIEDLPAGEVARRMNCSKATVRSHIANARVKFRRYLERRKP
jgi:RNA polymerase sigma-70 factor (ECF subfamily)